MKCRHCGSSVTLPFLDLGSAPPSNAFLDAVSLTQPETWYPLRILVCENCRLVQTEDYAGREKLFSDNYAYFSSFSSTWLRHAEHYAISAIRRFKLDHRSTVLEVAANDGYLLQFFKARQIPCYGIEPTASTANAARAKGIEVIEDFFGDTLANELASAGKTADLIVANNVLAHVPDINDFVKGFARLLKPQGVATFEFPHLLRMIQQCQFDTAYHEHFSYLSLSAVQQIFLSNGLDIFDVDALTTHGGSLRIYAQQNGGGQNVAPAVKAILLEEKTYGLDQNPAYSAMQSAAEKIKLDLLSFLVRCARNNETVCAYGAAAKGNTLLNFSGVRPDLVSHVADRNPEKQHKFMPGSRIPIIAPEALLSRRPKWILILPWNLREEIIAELSEARQWGCRFITAIPELRIYD